MLRLNACVVLPLEEPPTHNLRRQISTSAYIHISLSHTATHTHTHTRIRGRWGITPDVACSSDSTILMIKLINIRTCINGYTSVHLPLPSHTHTHTHTLPLSLSLSLSLSVCLSYKSAPRCQFDNVLMAKETYTYGKRDLYIWQKRHIHKRTAMPP